MPHKQQPVSVAELHDIYGGERSAPKAGSAATYRKTSFSVREADHPGSPPPRPVPDGKKRLR
ncbi:hypothetical protein [Frateuria soli]|uniref:hypothetical protein n=1 Tax=Frateuria soli TaxID=1542730 RepID=UPI001E473A6D|nr:hypothetical protein [Frateuria soli]UGB37165.1 hypothetical protein LQ771_09990 [Frateuria soli]